jgi:hypothetical protein
LEQRITERLGPDAERLTALLDEVIKTVRETDD